MKVDTNKITSAIIEEAAQEKNFNKALKIIQKAIGQTDGDIAGIHFSGMSDEENEENWRDTIKRKNIIHSYLKTEKEYS